MPGVATGLAVVTLYESTGRKLTLPDQVATALWRQQQLERASKGAKKAAGTPAAPAARIPTRHQRSRRSAAARKAAATRRAR